MSLHWLFKCHCEQSVGVSGSSHSQHLLRLSLSPHDCWPQWLPARPPSVASQKTLRSWGTKSDQASMSTVETTPTLAHMAHLNTYMYVRRLVRILSKLICSRLKMFDRYMVQCNNIESLSPVLVVLGSSEAPTAEWTVTSPSERHNSNSSSGFTDSEKTDYTSFTSRYIIPHLFIPAGK